METKNKNKEATKKLAQILKNFGYEVYLSENEEYGFYGNKEKVISFEINYFFFRFSANHRSKGLGSGYILTKDEQYRIWEIDNWASKNLFEDLLNCHPCIDSHGYFIRWTNLKEMLDIYKSSKFTKI